MDHDARKEADNGQRGARGDRGRVDVDRQAAEAQQDRHRGVAREDLIDPLARHQHID